MKKLIKKILILVFFLFPISVLASSEPAINEILENSTTKQTITFPALPSEAMQQNTENHHVKDNINMWLILFVSVCLTTIIPILKSLWNISKALNVIVFIFMIPTLLLALESVSVLPPRTSVFIQELILTQKTQLTKLENITIDTIKENFDIRKNQDGSWVINKI